MPKRLRLLSRFLLPLAAVLMLAPACRKPTGVSQECSFEAGMVIPIPLSATAVEPEGRFPGARDNASKPLRLTLNSAGMPTKLESELPEDSAWARYLEPTLRGYRFSPPIIAPFRLALTAQYSRSADGFTLLLPVDSACRAVDQDLVDKTLRMNGYEPAGIDYFPGYFCDLGPDNPEHSRRFILFSLALDSAGSCSEVSVVSTNYPAFVGQLTSALLYARFAPARFDGHAVDSRPFLLVSFYPYNRYPTLPFNDSTMNLMTFHERRALRILNDTSGIICKPVPNEVPYDSISIIGQAGFRTQRLTVSLSIDSLGRASVLDWKGLSASNRDGLKQMLRSLKFFPALDVQGRPKVYSGPITLEFSGNRRAKLIYHWL